VKNGKIFKIVGVIIFILGFIVGIYLGVSSNSIEEDLSGYDTFDPELMFSVFIGSFLLGMLFLWLGTVLERIEHIVNIIEIEKKVSIDANLLDNELQEPKSAEPKETILLLKTTCPKCGGNYAAMLPNCPYCGEENSAE
jgi:hypothetical protein